MEIHSSYPSEASGMVFVSSIDGYLRSIDPKTGIDQWVFKEEPVLRAPLTIQHGFTFIPDPKDGSLYLLRDGNLKKLPYSIPQLVASSPCRTTDGVMYAGSKRDVWLGLNPETGIKVEELSETAVPQKCPVNKENTIFIGRSEYHLSMFDLSNRSRKWNATFNDYSSHLLPADVSYPYQHFASSSDGQILTVDASTGAILWQRDIGSTIVAIYLLQNDGLHKLPYTVIGRETLEELIKNARSPDSNRWVDDLLHAQNDYNSAAQPKNLFPTLYVGESSYGIYATPAFVDERTITIAPKYLGPPLLEGPTPIAVKTSDAPHNAPSSRPIVRIHVNMPSITHRTVDGEFLLLGYHEPPETVSSQILPRSPVNMPVIPTITYVPSNKRPVQPREHRPLLELRPRVGSDWPLDVIFVQLWQQHPVTITSIVVTFLCLILATAWMCGRQSGLSASFTGEARSAQTSKRAARFWSERIEEVPEGWMCIGKIQYDPQSILGRGCEGTVVYRGKFETREVAVKRVVSDFIRLADREVDLLRESDAHSHVIRYFCMETDSQFRYIALELCDSSLNDYVEREDLRKNCPLNAMDILHQATNGVAHLHSLNIVHRDLKPQNILLSIPNAHGQVRALISDFGLCKRLQLGRNSVSRRSGLAGTDGWMAPEAMHCDTSVTRSVDIFSLGCIYYYVLSNGVHPFGDSFNRQGNIMRGTYSLKTLLLTGNFTGVDVIESMLQRDVLKRPTATELCAHPFFWSKERQLQFFLDVSDRIEKESEMDIIVRRLEKNNRGVVANNWRQVICPALAEDLRKFRTYKGTSVRDLLRAMRNKKHHYRELPENVRSSLGCVPDEFVTYFTSRFPQLLMHTYKALAACANEPVFSGYYSEHDRRRAAMLGDYTADSSADEWTPCANGGNRINRITFKNGIVE